jgi:nicotinate-nucleotide--dimethylbenzimidazole phosphoribosyltransferase
MSPQEQLAHLIDGVRPAEASAMDAARRRHQELAKPPGALGALEEVGARLAGSAGCCPPPDPAPLAVAVFAGDHGVHRQGVTPWPQEVTAQMVATFAAGGAAVNGLAHRLGASVVVVDVGVAGPVADAPSLRRRRVRAGTADLSVESAMTRPEAVAALLVGAQAAADLVADGHRLLVAGDMGIANTTPAAALVCAFTGATAAAVTGRGTGIDDTVLAHKVGVVERALHLHRPDPADPIGALAAVGGLEHAAIAGFLLQAAASRVPAVLDGVIACSAALTARALAPAAVDHWFAGHRSAEPGASLALAALGLEPLRDLGMRLGEGTGALLAAPLLQSAAAVLRDMATLRDAGVSQGAGSPTVTP